MSIIHLQTYIYNRNNFRQMQFAFDLFFFFAFLIVHLFHLLVNILINLLNLLLKASFNYF